MIGISFPKGKNEDAGDRKRKPLQGRRVLVGGNLLRFVEEALELFFGDTEFFRGFANGKTTLLNKAKQRFLLSFCKAFLTTFSKTFLTSFLNGKVIQF